MKTPLNQATLAGGCFWCLDAIYREVKGVSGVVSGYTGGHIDNPGYEQVHRTDTGHAEAVQITFEPAVISYRQLLEVFFYIHDPTTLNRQGNDVGSLYRSAIFYHDASQHQVAQAVISQFAPTLWEHPIVTEITPLSKFWPAEAEHQNFFRNHPEQAYCQVIINPKLQKFRHQFEALLKPI